MLTRKHFKAFAAIISKVENLEQRKLEALAYADLCARENPRFNLQKFLEACGVS